jgi:hypothetical protein
MSDFKAGDLIRVYYSVPVGLQSRIMQIRNPAYGENIKTVGHYFARVLHVEPYRIFAINVYNEIRHYVHPKQCRRVAVEAANKLP